MEEQNKPLEDDGCADQRAHRRDTMLLKTTMRIAGRFESLAFRVRNLSATGLMGESAMDVPPGTHVSVDLRNIGTVSAVVAWSTGGRFGLAFHEQIDPRLVRQEISAMALNPSPSPENVDLLVRRPLVLGKQPPRDPHDIRMV